MLDTKKFINDLQDLHQRLVLNYNDNVPFEQFEEDRLIVGNVIDMLTPKMPTYEDVNNVYGALKRTCANCGDVCMIDPNTKDFEHYCRYCGQKLVDWSDNK